jgi:hypothetical protein
MKVKDLIKLLQNCDENANVYYNSKFGAQKVQTAEAQLYFAKYFGRIITQEYHDSEFELRKSDLENCKAKKNTREYKDCLSSFEHIKNTKLFPVVFLK